MIRTYVKGKLVEHADSMAMTCDRILPALSWARKLDEQFVWNDTLSFKKGLSKSKRQAKNMFLSSWAY